MNNVTDFPFWLVLLVLAIFIVVTVVLAINYAKGKTLDSFREDVYQLFLKAEHTYSGSKTGQQKFDWVIGQAWNCLPTWVKFFVSKESLEAIIQSWFTEIKDLLDDGKVNHSATIDQAIEESIDE